MYRYRITGFDRERREFFDDCFMAKNKEHAADQWNKKYPGGAIELQVIVNLSVNRGGKFGGSNGFGVVDMGQSAR